MKRDQELDKKAVELQGQFLLMVVLLLFFFFGLAILLSALIWLHIMPLYFLFAPKS